jgi:hypothetical protein
MMDSNKYPPSDLSRLVRRVKGFPVSERMRNWIGNDEVRRHYHAVVDLNESPLRLCLSWKKSPKDPVLLIGVYDLDLRRLLDEQYVRREPRVRNGIRLRFYHSTSGVISVQTNINGPALPVGEAP